MQLEENLLKALDKLAKEHDIPRQRLISQILKKAIKSPDFVIERVE